MNSSFANGNECHNDGNGYCITVDVADYHKTQNKEDLCYVLQVNASDHYRSGSVAMERLPAVIFAISKDSEMLGKPLSFRVLKAEIVPAGQCGAKKTNLQPVQGCDIFEYEAISGVVRSIVLTGFQDDTSYSCELQD
jgi:hypothetical protein